jgi:hypothetical protein
MIISRDGSLVIDGNAVSSDTKLAVLEEMPVWSKSQLVSQSDQIKTFSVRPVLIDGLTFSIILVFRHEYISLIQLSLLLDEDKGWESWSEATEAKRKAKHDELLASALGSQPWNYSWGQVFSDYDPRSGSSAISVQFS